MYEKILKRNRKKNRKKLKKQTYTGVPNTIKKFEKKNKTKN